MNEYREGQPEMPTVEAYIDRTRAILHREGVPTVDKGADFARAQIFGIEGGEEESLRLFNEAIERMRAVTEENKRLAQPYKEKFESIYGPEHSDEQIEETTRRIVEFQTQFYKDYPESADYALYHVIAHSSSPYLPKFDTEDGKIARFIDSL